MQVFGTHLLHEKEAEEAEKGNGRKPTD